MTYYEDCSKCTYFSVEGMDNLLAIGWLEKEYPYEKGEVPRDFYRKLKKLFQRPWQPVAFCGPHFCSFCQFDQAGGTQNLFVPYDGNIYVAPSLIVHYIACHYYKPPDVFIEAVMACPPIKSIAYKKALLANGGRPLVRMSEM